MSNRPEAGAVANQGLITLGAAPGAELQLTIEVETLVRHYWLARRLGEPRLFTSDEMEAVLQHFES